MGLTLTKVHEYAKIRDEEGRELVKIVKRRPTIRLRSGYENPPIFIQEGQAYDEGGGIVSDANLPSWFFDEIKKVSHEALLQSNAQRYLELTDGVVMANGSSHSNGKSTLESVQTSKPEIGVKKKKKKKKISASGFRRKGW